jgi:hypothetical protein
MKNKTLALILVILFLIIILNFKLLITGLVTLSEQIGIGLSIASLMQGDIIALSAPNYIVQNDSAIILSTFQNTGNQVLTEKMGIYIINSSNITVWSVLDNNYTLSPLGTRTLMTTWDAYELGNFTIIANASYDSKTVQRNRTVRVVTLKEKEEITITPGVPPVSAGYVSRVGERKLLKIEFPIWVELTEDFVNIKINITNVGDVNLKNMLIKLTESDPINLYYDKSIGNLDVKKSKIVDVRISNSRVLHNFITMNISDSVDYWIETFVVYTPSPRALIKEDCVVIQPKEYATQANIPTTINITVINKCNLILNDVVVRIDELDYIEKIGTLTNTAVIHPNVTIREGEYTYKIKFTFVEGRSTDTITIYSLNYPLLLEEIKKAEQNLKRIQNRMRYIPIIINREWFYDNLGSIRTTIEVAKTFAREGKLIELYLLLGQITQNLDKLFNYLTLNLLFNILIFFTLINSPLLIVVIVKWRKKKEIEELKKTAKFEWPDLTKLPKKSPDTIWIGRLVELKNRAYMTIDQLKQHVLIAGGTGGGKSVNGMIIAEEILQRNIPVIVLDPTGQWGGFMKPCTERKMLDCYKKFDLKIEQRGKFSGRILEIRDPFTELDFLSMVKKGQILVLSLEKLQPRYVDLFTKRFIRYIFASNPKETTELKLLIVSEEVHRFLPKYGGQNAYLALESGVREFRKWGIGLVLISQVLTDFKGAIRANIGTEVQFRTKYSGDINMVKAKYGALYSSFVAKLPVGTGMYQNPEFNDGKPYFIEFRPLYHNPLGLTDAERKKIVYIVAKPEEEEKYIQEKFKKPKPGEIKKAEPVKIFRKYTEKKKKQLKKKPEKKKLKRIKNKEVKKKSIKKPIKKQEKKKK